MNKPVNKSKIAVRLLLLCLLVSLSTTAFLGWAVYKCSVSPPPPPHESTSLGWYSCPEDRIAEAATPRKPKRHHHIQTDMSVHPIYLPGADQ